MNDQVREFLEELFDTGAVPRGLLSAQVDTATGSFDAPKTSSAWRQAFVAEAEAAGVTTIQEAMTWVDGFMPGLGQAAIGEVAVTMGLHDDYEWIEV